MKHGHWIILVTLMLAWSAGWAGEARPLADNEAVEQRLINISRDMRCLVCQNESLAASQADLAEDLRQEIREQIRQGKTDRQITDYLVARYGDFVRYNPPVKPTTWALWFGPFLLMVGGAAGLWVVLRRRNRMAEEDPLSTDQRKQAEALLRDKT